MRRSTMDDGFMPAVSGDGRRGQSMPDRITLPPWLHGLEAVGEWVSDSVSAAASDGVRWDGESRLSLGMASAVDISVG
jgi:hypothetical protein